MIFFKSLTPEVTAEKCTQWAPAELARICARVVLPLPGGPHRINERNLPAPLKPRNSLPAPSKCSWPTNSSMEFGRIASASGCEARFLLAGTVSKRSMAKFMLAQLRGWIVVAENLLSLAVSRCYVARYSGKNSHGRSFEQG